MALAEILAHPLTGAFVDFLKVLLGGVIAAGLTLYVSGRRLERDKRQAASHLSAQLVRIFEKYATECARIPGEHSSYVRHDPTDYSGICSLPKLEPFPDDIIGFRSLPSSLNFASINFSNRIDFAIYLIRSDELFGDANDSERAVERKAAELGYAALNLAQELRKAYNHGPTDFTRASSDHFIQEFARFASEDEADRAASKSFDS